MLADHAALEDASKKRMLRRESAIGVPDGLASLGVCAWPAWDRSIVCDQAWKVFVLLGCEMLLS